MSLYLMKDTWLRYLPDLLLMMSADWHLQHKDLCGANEFIAKPFDIELVVKKIGLYLKAT